MEKTQVQRKAPLPLSLAIREERIEIDGILVKIQEFFDDNPFGENHAQDDMLEELRKRYILERDAGLESASRKTRGEIAYVERCIKGVQKNDPYFGAALSGHQLKILLVRFPVLYQSGFHDQYGDYEQYHIAKVGRGVINDWMMHCKDGVGDVSFGSAYWGSFTFGKTPIFVLHRIRELQNDPMVRELAIMTPREAINDPVLIANFYKFEWRIIARWGEALDPIRGIDS